MSQEKLLQAKNHFQSGHWGMALPLFEELCNAAPSNFEFLHYCGMCHLQLGNPKAALGALDKALALDSSSPFLVSNRGLVLKRLGRLREALDCLDMAIGMSSRPVFAFHNNRALILAELRRYKAAVESFTNAIDLKPDSAEALSNRGKCFTAMGRSEDAIRDLKRAVHSNPRFVEAHVNLADAYRSVGGYKEALDHDKAVIRLKPSAPNAIGYWIHDMLHGCNWDDLQDAVDRLRTRIAEGDAPADPFAVIAVNLTSAERQRCARQYGARNYPERNEPLWRGEIYRHERIRLAYLSSDFHNHATAHLFTRVLEQHDRTRFEVTAFSFGPVTTDPWRKRIEAAVEHFVECSSASDHEIAGLVRDCETDIAIDLKGYTKDHRMGIFSHRPAPIQVNYLGFPGTLGLPYIDYIIADAIVIPEQDLQFYDEQVVYLPGCYQPNDSTKEISPVFLDRCSHELPENAFVFCCFNNNYKIEPGVFAVWLRLLGRCSDSILWLLEGNPEAARNLKVRAEANGIDPNRLVFAKRAPLDRHLARHRLADLFLDTIPCNAHTTASDALWAGLPVLTCLGDSFAGKVCGSLLQALDLAELVTHSLQAYEQKALSLYEDRDRLRKIRGKLESNRMSSPLFDSDQYTLNLEKVLRGLQIRERLAK